MGFSVSGIAETETENVLLPVPWLDSRKCAPCSVFVSKTQPHRHSTYPKRRDPRCLVAPARGVRNPCLKSRQAYVGNRSVTLKQQIVPTFRKRGKRDTCSIFRKTPTSDPSTRTRVFRRSSSTCKKRANFEPLAAFCGKLLPLWTLLARLLDRQARD